LGVVKARPPPRADGPPKYELSIDYSDSQLPVSDKWLYIDPEYPEVYPPVERHSAWFLKSAVEVRGYVYPKYLNFSTVGGKRPSRLLVTVLLFHPLSSSFSPHEMSPQYHEVIFCLTHKGKFTYTLSSKSDFLSIFENTYYFILSMSHPLRYRISRCLVSYNNEQSEKVNDKK
jgi:hypothetical protein